MHFNSHPHEEDDNVSRFLNPSLYISTHILTKRMTKMFVYIISSTSISTHILTKRMTNLQRVLIKFFLFQLTSSRRGWPKAKKCTKEVLYFNSHPHEEDDLLYFCLCFYIRISTHILTKRMTVILVLLLFPVSSFQLTSSRRGWQQF